MYFSKVKIPCGAEYFSFLKESNFGNMYHAHQLLWKLFPYNPEAERDFIFREEQEQNRIYYYLVSKRKPETYSALEIQTKEYSPIINEGDYYSFTIRANPVVTRKREDKKNSSQHDVLMDAKKEAKENGLSDEDACNHINSKTIDWLQNKAEKHGFSISHEKATFKQYRQHNLYKKNKEKIHFSTVDYYGILKVKDSDVFQSSLFYGIGKKKAFGCGLLLIKPL